MGRIFDFLHRYFDNHCACRKFSTFGTKIQRHQSSSRKTFARQVGNVFFNNFIAVYDNSRTCVAGIQPSFFGRHFNGQAPRLDVQFFFGHLLRLPMQFFHQRYAAEVASRVNYNESVAGVLSGSAATAILDFFVAIFFLLLIFQYNVELTLTGIFFTTLDIAVFLAMRRKLTDLIMRIQQDAGKEYGVAMNGLLMIDSIKANGTESDFFTKWAGYRAKVLVATQEVQLWRLSFTMLPTLLAGLNGALIMTFGGFSIMEGAMTAGMFVAFQSLMGHFQEPVNNLLGLNQALQTTEMQMHRLDDVRRYDAERLNYPADENFSFAKKSCREKFYLTVLTENKFPA